MNSKCIVVPIHRELNSMPETELIALKQLFFILGKHSIYFVGPVNLNWNMFIEFAKVHDVQIKIANFETDYFANIKGYNRLMLSYRFYEFFKKYDYILIHQADAYVFRDEFENWCNKGYDYIGAPWFKGFKQPFLTDEIFGVGNGGFSLRKIDNAIRLLKRVKFLKRLNKIWIKCCIQNIYNFDKFILNFEKTFKVRGGRNPSDIFNIEEPNEDYYWSQIIAGVFVDYTVATVDEAIKFSFEVNPSLLFELNSHQLPFGCHAMHKYEPAFWDKYIHSEKTHQ